MSPIRKPGLHGRFVNEDLEHRLRRRIDEIWDQKDALRRENHRLKTQVYRLQQRLEVWQKRAQSR